MLGDGNSSGRVASISGVCLAEKTADTSVESAVEVVSPSVAIAAAAPLLPPARACSGRFVSGGSCAKLVGGSSRLCSKRVEA